MDNNNKDDTKTELPVSPLLDKAQLAYSNEKYEEAIKEAATHIDSVDQVLATDAHRLIGLCQFQLKNYEEAEKHFDAVIVSSSAPTDWFNICTLATMGGRIEKGKQAFDKGLELFKKVEGQFSGTIVNIMYYYMCALIDMKEYQRAFEQLESLKGFYANSPVSDFTYLTASAGTIIPSLRGLIETIKPILDFLGQEKADIWRKDFSAKMDDEGKATVLGSI